MEQGLNKDNTFKDDLFSMKQSYQINNEQSLKENNKQPFLKDMYIEQQQFNVECCKNFNTREKILLTHYSMNTVKVFKYSWFFIFTLFAIVFFIAQIFTRYTEKSNMEDFYVFFNVEIGTILIADIVFIVASFCCRNFNDRYFNIRLNDLRANTESAYKELNYIRKKTLYIPLYAKNVRQFFITILVIGATLVITPIFVAIFEKLVTSSLLISFSGALLILCSIYDYFYENKKIEEFKNILLIEIQKEKELKEQKELAKLERVRQAKEQEQKRIKQAKVEEQRKIQEKKQKAQENFKTLKQVIEGAKLLKQDETLQKYINNFFSKPTTRDVLGYIINRDEIALYGMPINIKMQKHSNVRITNYAPLFKKEDYDLLDKNDKKEFDIYSNLYTIKYTNQFLRKKSYIKKDNNRFEGYIKIETKNIFNYVCGQKFLDDEEISKEDRLMYLYSALVSQEIINDDYLTRQSFLFMLSEEFYSRVMQENYKYSKEFSLLDNDSTEDIILKLLMLNIGSKDIIYIIMCRDISLMKFEFDDKSDIKDLIIEISEKEKKKKYLKTLLTLDDKVKTTIADIDVMSGIEFERFISKMFNKMGYSTKVTKPSNDQGVDVIATKNDITIAIQAKCYSGVVGNHAIMEAVAGVKYYNANKCLVITNSTFTKSAKELAIKNNVELWDRKVLQEKIENIEI